MKIQLGCSQFFIRELLTDADGKSTQLEIRMDSLLKSLRDHGRQSDEVLARESGLQAHEVAEKIAEWESDGTILGYQAVVNEAKTEGNGVSASIEVRITPERGGGFDRLADRIARFDQVTSCSLFSGGYDLLVEVNGKDLMEVALFVSDKLSTIEGVLSTQTHFRLRTYKKNGLMFRQDLEDERLPVTP